MSYIRGNNRPSESLESRFRRENNERRRRDLEAELEYEANDIASEGSGVSQSVKITSVDFHAQANATNHHCEKYELLESQKDVSIIRRGGKFTIVVTFNKEVDLEKENTLKYYMFTGERDSANIINGTKAHLVATGKTVFTKGHEDWDIRISGTDGKSVTFEIQVPTDAPVGVWFSEFQVIDKMDSNINTIFSTEHLTYILFNPWNKDDCTFFPKQDDLEEYVLNDSGKIWQALKDSPGSVWTPWVYGQFDDIVLPTCVLLLDKAGVAAENRRDPVRVSRAISRMINDFDEEGVVAGKWYGSYKKGKHPSEWTGSIAILEEYANTNEPVKYGQCWVFGGVVNTVCRALGLPSRVVTNFLSAHDNDGSLTIDRYYGKNGEELNVSKKERIWNYHVWNEVWMERPELPEGYGGWQAIDATPQEQSGGKMQLGPTSLEAIRRGQLHFNYDVPFVLAEVNADVVTWLKDETAETGWKRVKSNSTLVGKMVLTKAPGNNPNSDVEDIIGSYKPKEGTIAERTLLYTAAGRSSAARHAVGLPSEDTEDVEFLIKDIERVRIGDDFSLAVYAENVSSVDRTVSVSVRLSSTYYTGTKAEEITKAEDTFTIRPNEEKSLTVPIPYKLYYPKLVEQAMMTVTATGWVHETSYTWNGVDTFQVMKPRLRIQLLTEAVANQPLNVSFSFTNPLKETLTTCSIMVEAPRLLRPKTLYLKDVGPKETMKHEMKLWPKKPAKATIVATFNSKELSDVKGSADVTISPSNA